MRLGQGVLADEALDILVIVRMDLADQAVVRFASFIRFVTEQGGEVEQLAQKIGAANTLTVRDDGSLYASNSDYAGALDAKAYESE